MITLSHLSKAETGDYHTRRAVQMKMQTGRLQPVKRCLFCPSYAKERHRAFSGVQEDRTGEAEPKMLQGVQVVAFGE